MAMIKRSAVFAGVVLLIALFIGLTQRWAEGASLEKTAVINFQRASDAATTTLTVGDLPPGTSPPSKLDLGPFEVHSMG